MNTSVQKLLASTPTVATTCLHGVCFVWFLKRFYCSLIKSQDLTSYPHSSHKILKYSVNCQKVKLSIYKIDGSVFGEMYLTIHRSEVSIEKIIFVKPFVYLDHYFTGGNVDLLGSIWI